MQGAGVAVADGFLPRAGLVDGLQRQGYLDELFVIGQCGFLILANAFWSFRAPRHEEFHAG